MPTPEMLETLEILKQMIDANDHSIETTNNMIEQMSKYPELAKGNDQLKKELDRLGLLTTEFKAMQTELESKG